MQHTLKRLEQPSAFDSISEQFFHVQLQATSTNSFYFFLHVAVMADAAAHFGAKLKWSKFSLAYRQRLIEGALALDAYLRRSGLRWESVEKQEPCMVDDVLESFVREMHSFRKNSSLRIAKPACGPIHAVCPPKIETQPECHLECRQKLGRAKAIWVQTTSSSCLTGGVAVSSQEELD